MTKDPLKHCILYKEKGCCHVDGYLCDVDKCNMLKEYKIEKICKDFEDRLAKYKQYTHEELAELEKKGIAGNVCTCKIVLCNSMTIECVRCGKIQPRFVKNYLKRCEEEEDDIK